MHRAARPRQRVLHRGAARRAARGPEQPQGGRTRSGRRRAARSSAPLLPAAPRPLSGGAANACTPRAPLGSRHARRRHLHAHSMPLHPSFPACIQICPYGLYAEQVSGTAFTVPRKCACRGLATCGCGARGRGAAGRHRSGGVRQPAPASRGCAPSTLSRSPHPTPLAPPPPPNPQVAAPHVAVPHPPLGHPRALPPPQLPGRDADRGLCVGRGDAQPAALAAIQHSLGARRLRARHVHSLRRRQVRRRRRGRAHAPGAGKGRPAGGAAGWRLPQPRKSLALRQAKHPSPSNGCAHLPAPQRRVQERLCRAHVHRQHQHGGHVPRQRGRRHAHRAAAGCGGGGGG
jgi:hypothetical protein